MSVTEVTQLRALRCLSRKENMKLKIQVLDETNSVVLDEEISVPAGIPYAPDGPQDGPISLTGLKTAIDYALFKRTTA